MSILQYIASDVPLLKLDAGEAMYHGEVAVLPFEKQRFLDDIYTAKPYRAELLWEYSGERAETVLRYIREQLSVAEEMELWHIWLGGLIEEEKGEYRPKLKSSRTREAEDIDWDDWKLNKVHKKEILFHNLSVEILKEFFFADSWNQRCLVVKK